MSYCLLFFSSCDTQELLKTSNELQFFHELVNRLNSQFQGFKVCGYLFVCFVDGRIKIAVEALSSLNIIGKSFFHLVFVVKHQFKGQNM